MGTDVSSGPVFLSKKRRIGSSSSGLIFLKEKKQKTTTPPSPQPLAIITLLFVSMNLTMLHTSYKWNYVIFDLL
ncbi:hypothetical protein C0133_08825 [Moraxella catarrhalis]|nr:hypothetical protein [Moraxella catarrhalis]